MSRHKPVHKGCTGRGQTAGGDQKYAWPKANRPAGAALAEVTDLGAPGDAKKEKSRCIQQRPLAGLARDQAVSPYTDTLTSTTTSVCSDTLTAESPTTLIGPWGMRTWALVKL